MSAVINSEEDGRAFELRALQLARALHDPAGTQGAIIVLGQERDGVFIGHEDIHVYEFTTEHKQEKAIKDAEKIAQLIGHLDGDPKHSFKPKTGWFVTRDEPEAHQRSVVASIAKENERTIHPISIGSPSDMVPRPIRKS